jgi:hypothetical protein
MSHDRCDVTRVTRVPLTFWEYKRADPLSFFSGIRRSHGLYPQLFSDLHPQSSEILKMPDAYRWFLGSPVAPAHLPKTTGTTTSEFITTDSWMATMADAVRLGFGRDKRDHFEFGVVGGKESDFIDSSWPRSIAPFEGDGSLYTIDVVIDGVDDEIKRLTNMRNAIVSTANELKARRDIKTRVYNFGIPESMITPDFTPDHDLYVSFSPQDWTHTLDEILVSDHIRQTGDHINPTPASSYCPCTVVLASTRVLPMHLTGTLPVSTSLQAVLFCQADRSIHGRSTMYADGIVKHPKREEILQVTPHPLLKDTIPMIIPSNRGIFIASQPTPPPPSRPDLPYVMLQDRDPLPRQEWRIFFDEGMSDLDVTPEEVPLTPLTSPSQQCAISCVKAWEGGPPLRLPSPPLPPYPEALPPTPMKRGVGGGAVSSPPFGAWSPLSLSAWA